MWEFWTTLPSTIPILTAFFAASFIATLVYVGADIPDVEVVVHGSQGIVIAVWGRFLVESLLAIPLHAPEAISSNLLDRLAYFWYMVK